jgi:hypothetical protein
MGDLAAAGAGVFFTWHGHNVCATKQQVHCGKCVDSEQNVMRMTCRGRAPHRARCSSCAVKSAHSDSSWRRPAAKALATAPHPAADRVSTNRRSAATDSLSV